MKKLSKFLIPTSILFAILILLNIKFGIVHKFAFINISFWPVVFTIIILNIISLGKLDKGKLKTISKIIHALFIIIFLIVSIYRVFITLLIPSFAGPEKNIDSYTFPDSSNQHLKNMYNAGISDITPPIILVYEKDLFLGIKCRTTLKFNFDNTDLFDLEKESEELKKIENAGFCYNKLN